MDESCSAYDGLPVLIRSKWHVLFWLAYTGLSSFLIGRPKPGSESIWINGIWIKITYKNEAFCLSHKSLLLMSPFTRIYQVLLQICDKWPYCRLHFCQSDLSMFWLPNGRPSDSFLCNAVFYIDIYLRIHSYVPVSRLLLFIVYASD